MGLGLKLIFYICKRYFYQNYFIKKFIFIFYTEFKQCQTLSDTYQQNKINFFRCFENIQTQSKFKEMLETYYIYLTKISLFFFNEDNCGALNNMHIFKKIYIWRARYF